MKTAVALSVHTTAVKVFAHVQRKETNLTRREERAPGAQSDTVLDSVSQSESKSDAVAHSG